MKHYKDLTLSELLDELVHLGATSASEDKTEQVKQEIIKRVRLAESHHPQGIRGE